MANYLQKIILSIGYYEAEAELGDLTFERSPFFGLDRNARFMSLGDVPPIVYSEVLADMLFFKENQIKKETN